VNFDISEEQQMLQATIRQLLENECPPTRLREIFDSASGHDPSLWKHMVEMGLAGLIVPEEHGGAGMGMLDLALSAEALAYGGAPGPFLGHSLAVLSIALAGSDEQKRSWLPRLATGDALATVALAEEGGIWQPDEWTLAGGADLTGSKTAVPYPELADVIVVGLAGGGFALVTREADGLTVKRVAGVDGARRIGSLVFENTPCEALPGGREAAPRVRDAGLILLAADAFGSGTRLVDMCVEHAKTREQFGVTIGHFQALKHQLATMALDMEPARGLYWYAAHAFDAIPEKCERIAAVAKAHITDNAMQVARDAVEAHGGIGFTWECDVQLWFKRAMFDRAFLGGPSVHRERAAALAGW
jgi:alkylation response protein AidB-like acyl-CoA dehydrogenase